MDLYASELESQLRGTTLDVSFEKGSSAHKRDSTAAGASGSSTNAEGQSTEALEPVNLDLNLVNSLMQSVASQQGFAGPGTNLASLLGLRLPQSVKTDGDAAM